MILKNALYIYVFAEKKNQILMIHAQTIFQCFIIVRLIISNPKIGKFIQR